MAKSERLEAGDNIYGHFMILNLCDVYLASKTIKFGKKTQIRAITPFKVIEVGINRKPVCDLLLVINSN